MSKTDKIKPDKTDPATRKRTQKIVRRSIHQALKTKDAEDVEEIVEALCQRTIVKRSRNGDAG